MKISKRFYCFTIIFILLYVQIAAFSSQLCCKGSKFSNYENCHEHVKVDSLKLYDCQCKDKILDIKEYLTSQRLFYLKYDKNKVHFITPKILIRLNHHGYEAQLSRYHRIKKNKLKPFICNGRILC